MLTLIESLQRQMKRYNRRRGSAMLMVLMTMAVIIVVGSSMLYITLSSFSLSIADTNHTKAYNAALIVSENVKNNMTEIFDVYSSQVGVDQKLYLNFSNNDTFDDSTVINDYALIDGVKVYVMLSVPTGELSSTVIVDVVGKYRSETSQVSFTVNRIEETRVTTLEDTFGNSFVMNSSLGSDTKNKNLTFRRIEGDISINCYEEDDAGNLHMSTRYFNPVVLEGVTGSIYANGDLIIGSYNNVIKVQGNIYVDGNLTVRGLQLGANLPALYKKEYKTKYVKYSTIGNKEFLGFQLLSTGEYADRLRTGNVGEAMYKQVSLTEYVPLQIYDEVSHYTLYDLFNDSSTNGTCTFWTMNYENSDAGVAEQVTIDLNKEPTDPVNKQYFGASMWYDYACTDPIMQYPEGGNIYCSGDIIFDRANSEYTWVYSADNLTDEYKYIDLSMEGAVTLDNNNNKILNPAVNQTVIYGDVFCLGRMIIAPENLGIIEKVGKNTVQNYEGLKFVTSGSYINADSIETQVASDPTVFFNKVKSFFGISGTNKWNVSLNTDVNGNAKNYRTGLSGYRFTLKDGVLSMSSGYKTQESFANDILVPFKDNVINNTNNEGHDAYATLSGLFNNTVTSNLAKLYKTNLALNGTGYYPGKPNTSAATTLRMPEFSESSNLYIYNWQYTTTDYDASIRKLNEGSDVPIRESSSADSIATTQYSTISNTLVNGATGTFSYDSALTVKFAELNVDKVYANGSIHVISIDAFGCVSDAKLTAKKLAATSTISSEYQDISLLDIVMYVNNKGETDEDELITIEEAKEIIKEEYWGFEENNDIYTGVGDLTYTFKDKEDLSSDHDVTVLSFTIDYNLQYANNFECNYVETNSWKTGALWYADCYGHWRLTDRNQKGRITDVSVKYEYIYYAENNKFYKLDGKSGKEKSEAEVKSALELDDAEIAAIKSGVYKFSYGMLMTAFNGESAKGYIESNYARTLYLSDTEKAQTFRDKIDSTIVGRTSSAEAIEHLDYKGVSIDSTKTRDDGYKFGRSQIRYFTLFDGQQRTDLDNFTISLPYDNVKSTLEGFFTNTKQLALVTNTANRFNAIVAEQNITIDSNYSGVTLDDKNIVNKYSNRAFYDKHRNDGNFYGMYLRSSMVGYNSVNKFASINDVFDAIMDKDFAKIVSQGVEALTEQSLRAKINKGEVNVKEFNTIKELSSDETKANGLYALEEVKGWNKTISDALYNRYYENASGSISLYGIEDLAMVGEQETYDQVWCYTLGSTAKRYFAIRNNTESGESNARVLQFGHTLSTSNKLTARNTFGIDPLYASFDEYGNATDGVSPELLGDIKRTQIDYTISESVYFNFGGETITTLRDADGDPYAASCTAGHDTEASGPVEFGASKNSGSVIDSFNQLMKTARMNIVVDTRSGPVYIYINAPSTYKEVGADKGDYVLKGTDSSGKGIYEYVGENKGSYSRTAGLILNKCTFRVLGENNMYIMLVGDTSMNANAYTLSTNMGGGAFSDTADRSDTMLGTHFYSGDYTEYVTKYLSPRDTGNRRSIAAIGKTPVKSGDLYIIGTMDNQLVLGRGGYINGFVFFPNGTYINRSKGFLGIIPNAYSANNQATIVAENISVEGSNIGNLIFQAFAVNAMGNSAGSNLSVDFITTEETVTTYYWKFGDYYYG